MVLRLCFIASLLGWAGATSTYQQLSASAANKLFLQVEDVAKSDVAEIEAVVSDVVAVASKEAKGARVRRLKKEFDSSWSNNLVIIPVLIVGSPLFYIWYKLEPVGKVDEIFTAIDSDLREVEIRAVGASGVALLRRQCDRHTGIMFAFTGIMLQTMFLYFIAVFCCQRIYHEAVREDTGSPTPIALLWCSVFCNTMTCSSSLILGLKCLATPAPDGYQKLHRALVIMDSFVIPSVSAVVGALYLCTSAGISSLVFSSTSMAFICSINMQIAGLMSWSLSGHGGRAFQPANVSIKDSENSTQYAHYSFIASAVAALAVLPIGFVFGIV
jgi:hypothetical protein